MSDDKTIDKLLTEQNKQVEQLDQTIAQEVPGYSSDMVIELLKKSLNIHWQQTTALSAQAIHLERWGYTKLSDILRKDAEEEHQHAIINLKRLEFFDIDYQPFMISPPVWKDTI